MPLRKPPGYQSPQFHPIPGIRLVVLLVPELHDLSSDSPYPPIYDKIGAALRNMEIDMINPLSRFQTTFSNDPSKAWAAPNDPHPNAKAHKIIADALYEYLAPRIDWLNGPDRR